MSFDFKIFVIHLWWHLGHSCASYGESRGAFIRTCSRTQCMDLKAAHPIHVYITTAHVGPPVTPAYTMQNTQTHTTITCVPSIFSIIVMLIYISLESSAISAQYLVATVHLVCWGHHVLYCIQLVSNQHHGTYDVLRVLLRCQTKLVLVYAQYMWFYLLVHAATQLVPSQRIDMLGRLRAQPCLLVLLYVFVLNTFFLSFDFSAG